MSGILERTVQEMERAEGAAGKLDPSFGAEPAAITRRMSDIRPEPVSWLWSGLIARGKVTLIAGTRDSANRSSPPRLRPACLPEPVGRSTALLHLEAMY